MGGILLPLPVDPGPNLYELPEIDLRVKVGRKISAVTSGIHIQYVNCVNLVEVTFYSQGTVGIDHTWIKTGPKYSCHTLFSTNILSFPLVISIPWRLLADLVRILMDCGIDVRRTGLDTSLKNRHIDEG